MKDAKGHGSDSRGTAQADIIKRAVLMQQRGRMAYQTEAAHQTGVAGISRSGAPLDRDGNPLEDMDRHPVQVDANGMVTLYHRTTPESADVILRTGRFSSKENTDETFFSNKRFGQAEGYGDAVVTARVRPEQTRINDAFHNGEVHVAVANNLLNKKSIVR